LYVQVRTNKDMTTTPSQKKPNKSRKNFRLCVRATALLARDARLNGRTETRIVEQLILAYCGRKGA